MVLEFDKSLPKSKEKNLYNYQFKFNSPEANESYDFELSMPAEEYPAYLVDFAKPYELLLSFLVKKLKDDGLKDCYSRYREYNFDDAKQILLDDLSLIHLKKCEKIVIKD